MMNPVIFGQSQAKAVPKKFRSVTKITQIADRQEQQAPPEACARPRARAAKVSTDTATRFERGDELKDRTIERSAACIEFTNGDQPGVRLTKAAVARSAQSRRAQSPRVGAKVFRGKKR